MIGWTREDYKPGRKRGQAKRTATAESGGSQGGSPTRSTGFSISFDAQDACAVGRYYVRAIPSAWKISYVRLKRSKQTSPLERERVANHRKQGDDMKTGILGSIAALLAGTGVAVAQAPPTPAPAQTAVVTAGAADALPGAGCNGGCAGTESCAPACIDRDCRELDHSRLWGSADYLLWKLRDQKFPALNQMFPFAVTGFDVANNQVTVPQGNSLSFPDRSGFRLSAGYWLDSDHHAGVMASFFLVDRFTAGSGITSVSDAPVTVVGNTITPGTLIVLPDGTQVQNPAQVGGFVGALPVQLTSTAIVQATSKIWGAEVNATSKICSIFSDHATLFGGFRFLDLDESLTVNDELSLRRGDGPLTSPTFNQVNPPGSGRIVSIPIPVPPPDINTLSRVVTFDRILTKNQFYGFQLGAAFDYSCHNWSINVIGKLGLGEMHQTLDFQGSTTTVISAVDQATGAILPLPPTVRTSQGGLLTSPLNLGRQTRDRWAFIPEVNVSLGYNWTENIRTTIGYDFIMLQNVVRPGEQVGYGTSNAQVSVNGRETMVDIARPGIRYSQVDVWLQGIHAGLEFRY